MQWLVDLFNKLLVFLYQLIISLVDMLKDMFFWIVEQVFLVAKTVLSGVLALFEPIDISQYMTALPSSVAWVFSVIGIPQCLIIIAAAISARLIMQLIPFTRLGS